MNIAYSIYFLWLSTAATAEMLSLQLSDDMALKQSESWPCAARGKIFQRFLSPAVPGAIPCQHLAAPLSIRAEVGC